MQLGKLELKAYLWLRDEISKTVNNSYYHLGNIRTSEVAKRMDESSSYVSRAFSGLAKKGVLEKTGHGQWQVTHLMIASATEGQPAPNDSELFDLV